MLSSTGKNGRHGSAGAIALTAGALGLGVSTAHGAFAMDDIDAWIGAGSNEAVLVIDWHDGLAPESLAWGYRWDGAATGWDMLTAVMAADPRLHRVMGGGGPDTLFGLGYDLDNDGFGHQTGPDETGFATDPDDHYREGWFTAGFWAYFAADGPVGPFDGGAPFEVSWEAAADRELADGSWDAWVFDAGFSFEVEPGEPVAAAAIPAPAAGLWTIAGAVLGGTRRRRQAA